MNRAPCSKSNIAGCKVWKFSAKVASLNHYRIPTKCHKKQRETRITKVLVVWCHLPYWFGLHPAPRIPVTNERLYGFPTKKVIILVMTVTGWGRCNISISSKEPEILSLFKSLRSNQAHLFQRCFELSAAVEWNSLMIHWWKGKDAENVHLNSMIRFNTQEILGS